MAFIESGKKFDKDEHHDKMKKRMDNLDTTQYPLRIPTALHKKVKIKIAKEGVNLRAVLIGMLEEYVKK